MAVNWLQNQLITNNYSCSIQSSYSGQGALYTNNLLTNVLTCCDVEKEKQWNTSEGCEDKPDDTQRLEPKTDQYIDRLRKTTLQSLCREDLGCNRYR